MTELYIKEIYFGMQGEGLFIGEPAVFIEFSANGVKMPLPEIVKAIEAHDCAHIVCNGEDPLAQQGNLFELLKLLPNHFIEVETGGEIQPISELKNFVHYFNVSPETSKLREMAKDIKIMFPYDKASYKFAVKRKEDVEDALHFIDKKFIGEHQVLLMPAVETREEYLGLAPKVIELCKEYGLRFCPRENIVIYGKKRGAKC